MTRIPELSLDDSQPGAQWAREAQKQMIVAEGQSVGPDYHKFERLPSYEGYAGMCACGFETPEPAYDSVGPLTNAIMQHLERDVFPQVDEALLIKEAGFFKIGKLIGYHRLIETTEEHGTRHMGWLVAGVEGTLRVHPDGHGQFQGRWSAFMTDSQEG
ncbi:MULTISPECIES: hypothetical protein [Streptomyces]|uniref:hypothetical protein n=1 Tax=Streptomyces TaxID=1883 RepID=UPI0004CCE0DE|nr:MULTISPECIES: hypothetical protein [Streptomyces]KOT51148.1 hypothetical protein ADK43_32655 [Streptomyces rimosus subsp. rimosus]